MVSCEPIGVIRSPYKAAEGVPIQPVFSKSVTARVEVFPEFQQGLKDLDGFSHIMLLYFFHQSDGYCLLCRPFLDNQPRGLFSTRAPRRPNPIGLSIVELITIEDNVITIGSPDMIDGTPLLDIKPYMEKFDVKENVRNGWYELADNRKQITADSRFTHESKK